MKRQNTILTVVEAGAEPPVVPVIGLALIRIYPQVPSPPQTSSGKPGHGSLHLSVPTWTLSLGMMFEHQQRDPLTIARPLLLPLQKLEHRPSDCQSLWSSE